MKLTEEQMEVIEKVSALVVYIAAVALAASLVFWLISLGLAAK